MDIEKDEEFLIYRLTNSSPEYVYEWLKENASKDEDRRLSGSEKLEQELAKRNEPIINLGLALYGQVADTGYCLYKSGDITIKKAALAGSTLKDCLTNILVEEEKTWVEEKNIIPELIKENNDDLFYAYLSNKYIGDHLLENLYGKTGVFEDVDEATWRLFIRCSSLNEAIRTPYDDSFMDGYAEYSHGRKFGIARGLFDKVPVTAKWAQVLRELSDHLRADSTYDFDVESALKRWEKDEGEYKYWNAYAGCRINLCKCIGTYDDKFKKLKSSSDLARRQGYYSKFKPNGENEIIECFEKDQEHFLDVAIYNLNLWRHSEYREALKKCSWDYKHPLSYLDYPNSFNAREEYLREKYPDWFEEEDSEY